MSANTEDTGTVLFQVLPWLRAIDDLEGAVRQFLDRTGSEAELAQCWHNYHETAREFLDE